MEFKDVIEKRRSIRKFTNDEVDNQLLIELIRLATLAPSAHNRQPWRFMIVKDDKKDMIVSMMNEFYDKYKDKVSKTMPFTALVIDESNALIVVFRDGLKEDRYLDTLSIGGAIEHICLGATSMGLGSVWINDIDPVKENIAKYLGYGDLEIVSVVAIGYPNQDPKPRPRKELNDVILK